MKNILNKNKTFSVLVIGALIVLSLIYFWNLKSISSVKLTKSRCLAPAQVLVTKVIDGDTIVVEGGYHVRLLGIDTDEKNHPCYKAAKSRLENLILDKVVRLERDKTDIDKYGRCLRYVFLDGKNINLELVKEGLAVARFYEPDIKYKKEIAKAEKEAVDNKIGCKWSPVQQANGIGVLKKTKTNLKWLKLTKEKLGYKVVDACRASKYLGKKIIVQGKVVDAYRSPKSNTVFLNFEKSYPNQCFTAVIFSSEISKVVNHPENYYKNKIVRVLGRVTKYKGRAEIILDSPSQIEIGK